MTFAYWCILIAYLLPLFCAAYAKKAGGFRFKDNHNPRDFLARTQGTAARAHPRSKTVLKPLHRLLPPF